MMMLQNKISKGEALDVDARTRFEAGLSKLRKKVHEICATINAQEDCPFLREQIYAKCEECPYREGKNILE